MESFDYNENSPSTRLGGIYHVGNLSFQEPNRVQIWPQYDKSTRSVVRSKR